MRRPLLIFAACVLLAFSAAGDEKKSPETKKAESIRKISERAGKLGAQSHFSNYCEFLHLTSARLVDRARTAPAGSYLFRRLTAAADDLLDGVEEIHKAGLHARDQEDGEKDAQQKTGRDLEQAYFRVTQGDYFAGLSREADAAEYVKTSRRLYQIARQAYDAGEFRRARRMSEAASEVIDALENLAQAAVPIPDPPRLKDQAGQSSGFAEAMGNAPAEAGRATPADAGRETQ